MASVSLANRRFRVNSGTQGPYVDLPLNYLTMQPQTTYTGSGIPPAVLAGFFADGGVRARSNAAVLEQTQALVPGMQAASTTRLVDINAATGAATYFADGTTSTGLADYFSNIRPNLTSSYVSADLSSIDNSISTNGLATGSPTGKQVLIPANGHLSVGLWTGAGYTITAQSSSKTSYSLSITQKISGGLSGGFSGNDVPAAMLNSSTGTQMVPTSGNSAVPAGAFAAPPPPASPKIAEPVDAITGAYIYQHTDLVAGGANGFPYALPFARTYTSSSNTTDVGLGEGWTHNYTVTATRSSDPFAGLGQSTAIRAASAIAALYVSQDLFTTYGRALNAQAMTLVWMTNRWLTDQLTNNSVTITWPGTNEGFAYLPHYDGASSTIYGAPLGSSAQLTGSAPDSYGNYTTFTYLNKDQSKLTFNPVNSAQNGQIASWTFPNGIGLGFAYNYSYGGADYLTSVTDTLGRSLTLSYSGAHVASVTDDSSRAIGYSYNGSNNVTSFTDPLGYQTTFAYDGSSHLTQVYYPFFPSNAFVSNTYDALGRGSQQADANGNITKFYFAGSRTETIDPTGDRHVTYQTPTGKVLKDDWVLSGTFGDVFNDTAQQNGVATLRATNMTGRTGWCWRRRPSLAPWDISIRAICSAM